MKTMFVLGILWVGSTMAQTALINDTFEAKAAPRAPEALVTKETTPQNQIVVHGVTYDGIAIAAVKADNKLQLLNPLAPQKYGTAEDSVVRDPITGIVSGLKIISLKF